MATESPHLWIEFMLRYHGNTRTKNDYYIIYHNILNIHMTRCDQDMSWRLLLQDLILPRCPRMSPCPPAEARSPSRWGILHTPQLTQTKALKIFKGLTPACFNLFHLVPSCFCGPVLIWSLEATRTWATWPMDPNLAKRNNIEIITEIRDAVL